VKKTKRKYEYSEWDKLPGGSLKDFTIIYLRNLYKVIPIKKGESYNDYSERLFKDFRDLLSCTIANDYVEEVIEEVKIQTIKEKREERKKKINSLKNI
jgi:hypothetical protein